MSEHPPQTNNETPNPADNFEDIRDLVEVGDDNNDDGVNTLHRPDGSGKLLSVDELEMLREYQDLIRSEGQEISEKDREIDPIKAEKIAHYIHKHSKGKGTSPDVVKELYKRLENESDEFLDDDPENPDSPEDDGGSPTSPESPENPPHSQEHAAEQAREEVNDLFEGNDDPTTETESVELDDVEDAPDVEQLLTPEETAIYEEIDAIDAIKKYDDRLKKLEDFALKNNGKIDSLGRDIGIEAAKRIESSQVRNPLNPRQLTLKLGKTRRRYNTLLAKMAKGGPNGANLAAAESMKRNWNPFFRKYVEGRNKVIYEVSEIFERQIKELPVEIEKLVSERDALLSREPDNSLISEKQKQLDTLEKALQDTSEQVLELENDKNDESQYTGMDKADVEAKKESYNKNIEKLNEKGQKITEALDGLNDEMNDLKQSQHAKDTKDAAKKQEEINQKQEVYTHSVNGSTEVESKINKTFLHSHKSSGKIKADRAVSRADTSILDELDTFGHKLKRQEALSKIVIEQVSNIEGLNEQQVQTLKADRIRFVNENIKNKKIKDKTIKQIT